MKVRYASPKPVATRSTMRLPNGAQAEVDTLDQITLIFLNVRKAPFDGRLRNLWAGRIGSPSVTGCVLPVTIVH